MGQHCKFITLIHWGRVTHKCLSKLPNFVSDNGVSPVQRKAIIWTNAAILLIRTFGSKLQWNLNYWGRVTCICTSKLTIMGSDNGLSPGRRQALIWTNAGLLSIGTAGTNFSEILVEIQTVFFKNIYLKISSRIWQLFCFDLNVLSEIETFSVRNMYLKMSPAKWRQFCLDLNVLTMPNVCADFSRQATLCRLSICSFLQFMKVIRSMWLCIQMAKKSFKIIGNL